MKRTDELTTEMHAEFAISEQNERKLTAWALFGMIANGMAEEDAFRIMRLSPDEVKPFLASYNELAPKQVKLKVSPLEGVF